MPYPTALTEINADVEVTGHIACKPERSGVMRLGIGIILAAALASVAPSLGAQAHQHAAPPVQPRPQVVTRFAADATLSREMHGIRTAVEALGHYEHGHMGPEQALILAKTIEGHLRTIIANCKLAPDADAALHEVIVPLMQGAGALKQRPEDLSPVAPMRSSLERYDRRFQES